MFVILDPFPENKKNAKRREVDNKQLKRVLSGVIEHVRIGHVLPPHSELLDSVFRRGLADRGMPLDIGEGSFYPNLPWMRRREERDFVRPRLFLPYFEEAKVIFCFVIVIVTHLVYTHVALLLCTRLSELVEQTKPKTFIQKMQTSCCSRNFSIIIIIFFSSSGNRTLLYSRLPSFSVFFTNHHVPQPLNPNPLFDLIM